ncbi:autoinducer 2 ABC transporter substrate-binding protein [Yersinia pseudotuberculosis]|uniref:substrate-binding domain-containing protein n=1 Tax=Yersinia pseudotuberculosis TaxID=633 RepID=UPI0038B49C98
MMIKKLCLIAALVFSLGIMGAYAQRSQSIVTVVKVIGEPWYTRMGEGAKEFGDENPSISTRTVGPARADSALQLRIVEDLIAKKVDALAVAPMDPSTLEGALKKAMSRGIIVVTNEAYDMVNMHADIEAVDNATFGAKINEGLVNCMGESGKWTTFVGSLGTNNHVLWAKSAAVNAQKYPNMTLVDPLNESFNDANRAYDKAKEIMRKYPDIKGFQGHSAIDVIGIGRAVEEAGLQGKICVFGIGLPQDSGKYLDSGAINGISFWDPKDASLAMDTVAKLLLDKKPLTDGMNLGVPGYENVAIRKGKGDGVLVIGDAAKFVDKTNWQQYPF